MTLQKSHPIAQHETPPAELATKAPLRLIAFALHGMPQRTGKVGDLKAALQHRVEPAFKWQGWWARVRPMLDDVEAFKLGKSGIKLTAEIADVPAYPLPAKAPKPAPRAQARSKSPSPSEILEWQRWFEGKRNAVPSKNGRPVKAAYVAIDECPAAAVQPALYRIIQAAEGLLSSDKPPKGAAEGWAKLLSHTAARRRNQDDRPADVALPALIAGLIIRLVVAAEFPPAIGKWICDAGALPAGEPETWRRGFAAGIWDWMPRSRHDIRNWFDQAFAQTPPADKTAVASEIALAAFAPGGSPISPASIDGLLASVSADGKAAFLRNLIVRSAAGRADQRNALDYIVHSQSQLPRAHQINLGVLAAILLPDAPTRLTEHAAQKIAQALDDPTDADDPTWNALLAESRQRIAARHESWQSDLHALKEEGENRQHSYETRLAERDDLIKRLRAEIAAGREEARIDIRQDMLTVISETILSLRQKQHDPTKMLQLVNDRLGLAFHAGGAEEFGCIGEAVSYNPVQHQTEGNITPGALARVVLPGAMIRGKLAGDRILVKARVAAPTEDAQC